MKCFRLRCYVNNSFLVFHQGTKHSKTIKHSRFALVFHTVFSCLDPLMKHSNSLFTYNIMHGKIFCCFYALLRNICKGKFRSRGTLNTSSRSHAMKSLYNVSEGCLVSKYFVISTCKNGVQSAILLLVSI